MKTTHLTTPLLLAVCTHGTLAAANPPLEELVISSSRVPTPLRQIGTSVSVVTRAEIEQRGFNSLYDVLRTQPGVGVSNQSGPGSVTSLRIRGEESYRTRFYLDGIDISDTSSPQNTPRVEQLLSSGIERVEILRGPQGLMYGADAGGVVNITSIAPEDGLSGRASAEGGRYGTRQLGGNIAGGNGTVDFSLNATDFQTDGYNATTTDTDIQDDDGYENTTMHGSFGWNIMEDLRATVTLRHMESENDYDQCFTVDDFSPSNDCSDEFEQNAWHTGVEYSNGRFGHELFYSNNDIDREFFTENQFAFMLNGELERSGYLGSFEGNENLRLVYGVDLQTESVDDGFSDTSRDQTGYYLEYQGGFADSLYVTAGVRYDDNDDFGSHTSYRVSAAYLIPLPGGELKLRSTFGTGFRAPSLNEIALNANPFTLPPAFGTELSEEESEGFDLAASWQADSGLYLEAIYFDQSISDEIFYDFNSFGYLQTSGDTESNGVELIAEWPILKSLRVTSNYTYTDSQDLNGDQRPRRPEHQGNLGLSWEAVPERLTLGLNLRLSRESVDVDGSELDDYEVLDLNASYRVGRGFEVFGRVENLTDEDYEEVPTYNTSGAAGYLGLRYSL